VNYAESLFDLTGDPKTPQPALTDEQRAAYRERVRESVDAIHAFYRVPEAR
jgi:hypothetical protein